MDEVDKNRLILEKKQPVSIEFYQLIDKSISINMILSIDNDLSIGFPVSDFID